MSFTGERYVPELRGQISYEHFHRYAIAIDLVRDKDVLDIASGEGYGTAALALVARSAVGVDLDEDSVRHAAARYTAMNLDFRVGDCTQIPAADASFDVVVSFETIEHLTGQERMLAEIKRVLRPDGRLIISSPNKLIYSDARSYENPHHVRELYFHEFRDALRVWFPSVRLFGQRIFAASAVHPLRGPGAATRWLGPSTVGEVAMTALPDPEYFLAVCGKVEDDELPDLGSVYLDPRDDLLDDVRSGGLAIQRDEPLRLSESAPTAIGRVAPAASGGAADGEAVAGLRAELESVRETERSTDQRLNQTLLELAQRTAERDEAVARAASAQDELRAAQEACRDLQRLMAQRQLEKANSDLLARRLVETETLLQEVVHSRSWQMTRPIRVAMMRLRGKPV
ncbi:MAG: methyltransferase domain-containing protein [Candidatus Elarobacter sp.]